MYLHFFVFFMEDTSYLIDAHYEMIIMDYYDP